MNDHFPLSDDDLKLTTARQLPADRELTADQAAARDAFLSLGQLLEATHAPAKEQAIVERLQKELAARPAEVTRSRPSGVASHRRLLWLLVGGALAASALVALVRLPTADVPSNSASQAADLLVAEENFQETPVLGEAWHDPLDDEIAFAAARMSQLSARDGGFDASLYGMNQELSALSAELLSESL